LATSAGGTASAARAGAIIPAAVTTERRRYGRAEKDLVIVNPPSKRTPATAPFGHRRDPD